MQRFTLVARSALAGFTMLSGSAVTHALEITAGDYEPLPAGISALLIYAQHAESSDFYSNGHKVSDDFRLKTDVGLLRYIHSFALTGNATALAVPRSNKKHATNIRLICATTFRHKPILRSVVATSMAEKTGRSASIRTTDLAPRIYA